MMGHHQLKNPQPRGGNKWLGLCGQIKTMVFFAQKFQDHRKRDLHVTTWTFLRMVLANVSLQGDTSSLENLLTIFLSAVHTANLYQCRVQLKNCPQYKHVNRYFLQNSVKCGKHRTSMHGDRELYLSKAPVGFLRLFEKTTTKKTPKKPVVYCKAKMRGL